MERRLTIAGRVIDEDSDCFVIAELGHNHQGSVNTCKKLMGAAQACGADAVKLQKRDNRTLFTKEQFNRPYDNRNSFGATYGEHRENLEFGWDEYVEVKAYAEGIGLVFFATAFDFPSADFLAKLDVPAFKIASGDLTNLPLLEYVASFGKPMLISTGGGTIEDVTRAYEAVAPINRNFCIMQCTAGYPPDYEELNLRVIETFRHRFPDTVIGLSSHDSGIAMATVAYVLGARVVEKHFTLNRAMKGTDHAFSLERPGLRRLVRDLRRARIALGDGKKVKYPSEDAPLHKMSKKLVAARDLDAGRILSKGDVAIKSPGDGLPPYEIANIIGKTLKRALAKDEGFSFEDLK